MNASDIARQILVANGWSRSKAIAAAKSIYKPTVAPLICTWINLNRYTCP